MTTTIENITREAVLHELERGPKVDEVKVDIADEREDGDIAEALTRQITGPSANSRLRDSRGA
jgi:hypothetical protein